MKIRMKDTKKGSPDGVLVNEYQKRRIYDLPDRLADAFVRAGWASIVKPQEPDETKVEEPPETKVIEPPETKEEPPDKTDDGLEEPEGEKPPEKEDKEKEKK